VIFVNGENPDAQIEPAILTAPAGRVTLFDTGA